MSTEEDDLFFENFGDPSAQNQPELQRPMDPSKYVQSLTQAWINERAAPDLLDYQEESVAGLLAKVDQQMEVIDELDSRNEASVIISILYQTELERIKFVLRSYLRTRISKIEKYCQHILADPSAKARLSRAEITYAESYANMCTQHYQSSFLSSLPPALQSQEESVFDRKLSMISQPSLDEAVFCRIVQDRDELRLNDQEFLQLEKGQIYLFRYRYIRALLVRGEIELI